ncbi:hypothetical protein G7Y89_g7703 [Cudoniella acicularis]|uniref:Uncharacterized protein n=1 Tax=Cudoniella acicularis TaxID=354080 RepID=A0A8H4RI06_9HELO|nr:hypothetical protein G7Y89_g7703 [Cudoniella acicularis]
MPSNYATKIKQRLLTTRDIKDTRIVMSPYTRYTKENRRYIVKKERSARYSEYDSKVLSIIAPKEAKRKGKEIPNDPIVLLSDDDNAL